MFVVTISVEAISAIHRPASVLRQRFSHFITGLLQKMIFYIEIKTIISTIKKTKSTTFLFKKSRSTMILMIMYNIRIT